jgi:hypothetical protein
VRVLDIDLDFFLDGIIYWASGDRRIDSKAFHPWSQRSVRKFLSKNCGIHQDRRIPGRIVEHHFEAFTFWREMIEAGRLKPPFELFHIDAHSDLGLGDGGWVYLMTEVLHWPVSQRANPSIGSRQMNAGNYLSFAVACRWILNLTFVTIPENRGDLMPYHFRGFTSTSGIIELKCCDKDRMNLGTGSHPTNESMGVVSLEPPVPFKQMFGNEFRENGKFDFVVLSRSPGFTPKESDQLIPVIGQVIAET